MFALNHTTLPLPDSRVSHTVPVPRVETKESFRYVISGHGSLKNQGTIRLSDYHATVVTTVPIGNKDVWGNEAKQIQKIQQGQVLTNVYQTTDTIPEALLQGDDDQEYSGIFRIRSNGEVYCLTRW